MNPASRSRYGVVPALLAMATVGVATTAVDLSPSGVRLAAAVLSCGAPCEPLLLGLAKTGQTQCWDDAGFAVACAGTLMPRRSQVAAIAWVSARPSNARLRASHQMS